MNELKFVRGEVIKADKLNKLQIESTTYEELKTLRDNGGLLPGKSYRITDYECTTALEDTQSAGHVFDIIVTADSEDTLNENARAIKHDGDTYFENCDLSAWELKYSIDNDTTRFAWAKEENGKGVIFYMKDEFNNECPYDFKNILFIRHKIKYDKIYSGDCDTATSVAKALRQQIYTSLASSQNTPQFYGGGQAYDGDYFQMCYNRYHFQMY